MALKLGMCVAWFLSTVAVHLAAEFLFGVTLFTPYNTTDYAPGILSLYDLADRMKGIIVAQDGFAIRVNDTWWGYGLMSGGGQISAPALTWPIIIGCLSSIAALPYFLAATPDDSSAPPQPQRNGDRPQPRSSEKQLLETAWLPITEGGKRPLGLTLVMGFSIIELLYNAFLYLGQSSQSFEESLEDPLFSFGLFSDIILSVLAIVAAIGLMRLRKWSVDLYRWIFRADALMFLAVLWVLNERFDALSNSSMGFEESFDLLGFFTGDPLSTANLMGTIVCCIYLEYLEMKSNKSSAPPVQRAQVAFGHSDQHGARAGWDDDIAAWDAIQNKENIENLQKYLLHHPNGRFAELAKIKLVRLEGGPFAATESTAATSSEATDYPRLAIDLSSPPAHRPPIIATPPEVPSASRQRSAPKSSALGGVFAKVALLAVLLGTMLATIYSPLFNSVGIDSASEDETDGTPLTAEDMPAMLAAALPADSVGVAAMDFLQKGGGQEVILLTGQDSSEGCHSCRGTHSVYRLKRSGGGFVKELQLLDVYQSGSYGRYNRDLKLEVIGRNGGPTYAVLLDVGGYLGQGCSSSSVIISALHDTGTTRVLAAPMGYDYNGEALEAEVVDPAPDNADFAIKYRRRTSTGAQEFVVVPYVFADGISLTPSIVPPEWTQRGC